MTDPIDGTRNFSRGIPVWASLIALERHGRVVAVSTNGLLHDEVLAFLAG